MLEGLIVLDDLPNHLDRLHLLFSRGLRVGQTVPREVQVDDSTILTEDLNHRQHLLGSHCVPAHVKVDQAF